MVCGLCSHLCGATACSLLAYRILILVSIDYSILYIVSRRNETISYRFNYEPQPVRLLCVRQRACLRDGTPPPSHGVPLRFPSISITIFFFPAARSCVSHRSTKILGCVRLLRWFGHSVISCHRLGIVVVVLCTMCRSPDAVGGNCIKPTTVYLDV